MYSGANEFSAENSKNETLGSKAEKQETEM